MAKPDNKTIKANTICNKGSNNNKRLVITVIIIPIIIIIIIYLIRYLPIMGCC